MAKYHKYVFDTNQRKFVGDFENMYRQESVEIFDSWHQEDQRQLQRKIDLELINGYNFDCIVDLGCGKGSFSHLLKRKNNNVYSFDISETAIKFANERYPDINFSTANANDIDSFKAILNEISIRHNKIDLFFSSEVLSYVENWKKLIEIIEAEYILISLYIPDNPIGYVKSDAELFGEINKWFNPVEIISLRISNFTIYFGKKK